MMGHAYYGNYLYWFEQARGAWCRDRGFTYKELEEQGYKLPVVEVWARYKGEVKYDDWIVVQVSLSERKRASLKFEYKIFNESTESIVTEGYTWHVLVGDKMKVIGIAGKFKDYLDRDPDQFDRLP